MMMDFIKVSNKKLRSIVTGGMELSLCAALKEVIHHSLVVAYDDGDSDICRIGFAVGASYGYTSSLSTNKNKVFVLDPVDGSVVYYDHIVSVELSDCPDAIVNRGCGCSDYEVAKVVGLSEDLTKFRIILRHSGDVDEISFDKVQFIDNVKMGVLKED